MQVTGTQVRRDAVGSASASGVSRSREFDRRGAKHDVAPWNDKHDRADRRAQRRQLREPGVEHVGAERLADQHHMTGPAERHRAAHRARDQRARLGGGAAGREKGQAVDGNDRGIAARMEPRGDLRGHPDAVAHVARQHDERGAFGPDLPGGGQIVEDRVAIIAEMDVIEAGAEQREQEHEQPRASPSPVSRSFVSCALIGGRPPPQADARITILSCAGHPGDGLAGLEAKGSKAIELLRRPEPQAGRGLTRHPLTPARLYPAVALGPGGWPLFDGSPVRYGQSHHGLHGHARRAVLYSVEVFWFGRDDAMADGKARYQAYNAPAGGWARRRRRRRSLLEQSVVTKGSRALLSMNQPGGFKCPSCAFPDATCTKKLEFCENGAKALAHEATKFRVTRDFFAQHSVTERWSSRTIGSRCRAG